MSDAEKEETGEQVIEEEEKGEMTVQTSIQKVLKKSLYHDGKKHI